MSGSAPCPFFSAISANWKINISKLAMIFRLLLAQKSFCHSRENGNPEPMKRKYWIPAFAGMTARDFPRF
jgi:hypothetical protein